jgi:hypothetical protein
LNEEPQPQGYLPLTQGQQVAGWIATGMALVVRTDSGPLELSNAVRREVQSLDS